MLVLSEMGEANGLGVGQHCGNVGIGDAVVVGVADGVAVALGVGLPQKDLNDCEIHEIVAFAPSVHVVVAVEGAAIRYAFIGTANAGFVGSINSVKPFVGPVTKDDAVSY